MEKGREDMLEWIHDRDMDHWPCAMMGCRWAQKNKKEDLRKAQRERYGIVAKEEAKL